MSCVSYFVAMCILSPLGRERQMAMSSIAADPVSVALNLLLDGPFGAVGAGVALLATEATVLCIELCTAGFPTGLDMAIAETKLLRELGGVGRAMPTLNVV